MMHLTLTALWMKGVIFAKICVFKVFGIEHEGPGTRMFNLPNRHIVRVFI